MKSTFWCATLLICVTPLAAQSDKAIHEMAALHATKREAHDAFKSGNPVAAFAKLRANLRKDSSADSDELQFAEQCREVLNWLANEREDNVSTIALQAVGEIESDRPKVRASEMAEVLTIQGRLFEIAGDRSKAQARYEAAVRLDTTKQEALAALARFRAVDELVKSKAQENIVLQQAAQSRQ